MLVSSLIEVAGGAALLVNPLEAAFTAQEIRRLDRDTDLRNVLKRMGIDHAKIFSEENYAKRTKAIYAKFH